MGVARLAMANDRQAFGEMRTAIRFAAGQQDPGMAPVPEASGGYRTVIGSSEGDGTGASRIRFVRNHLPRIGDIYCNEILREAPDVEVVPVTGGDVRAAPLAEMNREVYEHHKRATTPNYRQRIDDDVTDFVVTGEIATKLYWDDRVGCVREEGVPPFDLLRAPASRTVEESPWLIYRNIYTRGQMARIFGEGVARATASAGMAGTDFETRPYVVFRTSDQEYAQVEGTEVLEYYEKPSWRFPQGRYYFFTADRLLRQGSLPGGVFPIVVQRFFKTSRFPRGHGFVRNVYRLQLEINRAAGQDSTNMSHFGDDKFVTHSGSNLDAGDRLQGASHLKVSGFNDIRTSFLYVEGKGMPKYVEYIQALVREMDYKCHIKTQMEERKGPAKGGDLSVVLYSQIKDKKLFVKYAQSFEDFMVTKGKAILSLYRHYLRPEDVIHSGNREKRVLVPDFKRTSDRDFLFAVVAGNESDESRLGKQLVVDNVLQYAGQRLNEANIGLLLRNTALGADRRLIDHFCVDYDSWTYDQVRLEKGMMPPISPVEDFAYKAKMCSERMRKADFLELNPVVQGVFNQYLQVCKDGIARQENDRLRLEKGVIPTDGPLVRTDARRSVPKQGGGYKTEPLAIPYAALIWLTQALEKQGATQDALSGLPAQVQADIMDQVSSASEQLAAPQAPPWAQAAGPPPQAAPPPMAA